MLKYVDIRKTKQAVDMCATRHSSYTFNNKRVYCMYGVLFCVLFTDQSLHCFSESERILSKQSQKLDNSMALSQGLVGGGHQA